MPIEEVVKDSLEENRMYSKETTLAMAVNRNVKLKETNKALNDMLSTALSERDMYREALSNVVRYLTALEDGFRNMKVEGPAKIISDFAADEVAIVLDNCPMKCSKPDFETVFKKE